VTLFETGGLVDELKGRLAQRMLNGEMEHYLDTAREEEAGNYPQWVRHEDGTHGHGQAGADDSARSPRALRAGFDRQV
jgi:hypothetical protein